jgi:hypothetical protein
LLLNLNFLQRETVGILVALPGCDAVKA